MQYAHHTLLPGGGASQEAHHLPPWPPAWRERYGMETVQVQPGECLVFSEKCIHATAPYTGAGERRTLFCRYVPHDAPACPDLRFQHDATAPGLTEAQRCILGKGDDMAPSPKL